MPRKDSLSQLGVLLVKSVALSMVRCDVSSTHTAPRGTGFQADLSLFIGKKHLISLGLSLFILDHKYSLE